jgi:glycosyltransferase involved in cell wall biosynthesis
MRPNGKVKFVLERTRATTRRHALTDLQQNNGCEKRPRLVVFTMQFPHLGQPIAGVFIRERMFRVGRSLPLVVVAPVPWFPFRGLIRRWRPHFRPAAPRHEIQQGFEVFHPRFLSVPGLFKSLDGLFMALGSLLTFIRLRRRFDFDVIDAHFAYPDGYAATLLGKWLRRPVTITLRGTIVRLSRSTLHRRLIVKALRRAAQIFSVAGFLKQHAVELGIQADKILVVGNGVDTEKFQPLPRVSARHKLNLPPDVPVVISVGGLVERKGFHRVIACLPSIRSKFPGIRYLVVGGPGPEGDWSDMLRQQVAQLGLEQTVMFLGVISPAELKVALSAADIFVLATRNEGWANVFLEAMACGLPVITTDVGGNAEVINKPELGTLVPFDDQQALEQSLTEALTRIWDRDAIVAHAQANSWDHRVAVLLEEFRRLCKPGTDAEAVCMRREEEQLIE